MMLLALLFVFAPAWADAQVCGDCNGDASVNIVDALQGAQHAVGLISLPGPAFCRCDVDASTAVTVIDALVIAQTGAGLPTTLACQPACGGGGLPPYPGAGSGAHYWIDAAGGSDANPGSMAAPWQTIEKLEQVTLAPGDLVHVVAGAYDVSGSLRLAGITGSPSAWIGIQAEGAVTVRNLAVQNVINVEGCAYLFLRGFEITHDNGGAAYGAWDPVDGIKFQTTSSNDIAIDSCRIHHLGNVGVSAQAPQVLRVRVVATEIHDCYTGIYWGYYEDPTKRYAHECEIRGSYIHDCPPIDLDGTGYGIQIKGGSRGNLIADNVLVRTSGSSRAAIAVYHISTDLGVETARNVIRGNLIRTARGEGIYASEGALIENNVVVDANAAGISLSRRDTGAWGVFYGNLTVRNNSVFGVGSPSGAALFVATGAFVAPFEVGSNFLAVTGGGQLSLRLPAGFSGTSLANACFGASSGGGAFALPDLSAVLSTSFGHPDFLFPTPGGALADAGSPALASPEDFNHTARDPAPECGAYESTGGVNPGWTLAESFKP